MGGPKNINLDRFYCSSIKIPYCFWQHIFVNSIQISYALQSITTTQLIQWHCYHLLHRHNNPKTCIIFLQIGAQPLTHKYECNVLHSSSLPKFFLCPQTQQQPVYKTIHLFLTLYATLYVPYSHEPSLKLQTILFSLQNHCLNIHNMLHRHVQKHV